MLLMSHTAFDVSVCIITALSCLSNLQFSEKFQEVKEAAKLARDKSQDTVEMLSNHSQVKYLSLCCLNTSVAGNIEEKISNKTFQFVYFPLNTIGRCVSDSVFRKGSWHDRVFK